jgi:hypothetical protein
MLLPKIFALMIAGAILATSILIFVLGAKFRQVELAAYAGKRKPWWFIAAMAVYIVFYLLALFAFITSPERSAAAWMLMVVIPVGVCLKLALVILNPKGQAVVTSIEGTDNWRRIAVARSVLVPIFLALAYFI